MEIILKEAAELVNKNKFNDAIVLLIEYNGQSEFDGKFNEIYYLWGKYSFNNEDYNNAIEIFKISVNYKDSQELLKEAIYNKSINLIKIGDLSNAKILLEDIKNYKDAEQWINNISILEPYQGTWGYGDLIVHGLNYSIETRVYNKYNLSEIKVDTYPCEIDGNNLKSINGDIISLVDDRLIFDDTSYRKRNDSILLPQARVIPEPRIGMTDQEVNDSTWGSPKDINKTTNKYGVHEQWVYSYNRYIYLDNGIVTSIQE